MASTSKYIQIDPQILVEYIYEDSATSGVTGGEYETDNTGGNGIRCHVLTNDYTNTRFFFNEDSPQAGVSTGNKRTHSAVPINTDRNKYAWLTLTGALFYGDYDSNITNELTKLGRVGIPVYVIYLPNKVEPILLPEILTKKILKQYILKN